MPLGAVLRASGARHVIEDVAAGARLLTGLPSFWRGQLSVEQARAIARRRLERREVDFLAVVRRGIYGRPTNPYRQLLFAIGCEYGDVERLVGQEGVEGCLRALLRQGIYLTVDELKGRRPVSRGSALIEVSL